MTLTKSMQEEIEKAAAKEYPLVESGPDYDLNDAHEYKRDGALFGAEHLAKILTERGDEFDRKAAVDETIAFIKSKKKGLHLDSQEMSILMWHLIEWQHAQDKLHNEAKLEVLRAEVERLKANSLPVGRDTGKPFKKLREKFPVRYGVLVYPDGSKHEAHFITAEDVEYSEEEPK